MAQLATKELAENRVYKGEAATELENLYKVISRLWQEHRTSPTRAGDELVYAFGNLDYVIVINQDLLNSLVEVKTKLGNVDCFIDEDNQVTCKLNVDPKEGGREGANIKMILANTVKAMEIYYLNSRRTI